MSAPTFTQVESVISATFTSEKSEMKDVAYSNIAAADQWTFPFMFPLNIFLSREPVETFIIRMDTVLTFRESHSTAEGTIGSEWQGAPEGKWLIRRTDDGCV